MREVYSRYSSETYLDISVNGKICPGLVDTGSDKSLIPRRLVPRSDLTPADIKLWAANGTEIVVLGSMYLRYSIETQTLVTKFLVTDQIDELIFGYSWLVDNQCQWDFERKILHIKGQAVELRTRHSRPTVRRIYTRERMVVPPSMQANIPVNMPYTNLRTTESDWLAEAKTMAPGVFTARTLLPADDRYAAIQIVNVSGKPFTLRKGVCMGIVDGGGKCCGP